MVNLQDSRIRIKEFINSAIQKFEEEYRKPNSIGIYCCPWAGWLTANFNLQISLESIGNNCPDFEYLEYDYLDLANWAKEYERDFPNFKLEDQIIIHNHELGDENFNKIVFDFLIPIVEEIKKEYNSKFLI